MRASNIGEPIKFEYNAQVFQNTGVNWNNCNLSIATGNPILGGNKPELYTWSIGEYNYSNGLTKSYENNYLYEDREDDLKKMELATVQIVSKEKLSRKTLVYSICPTPPRQHALAYKFVKNRLSSLSQETGS